MSDHMNAPRITYEVGQLLQWTPKWWRWDSAREVTVERVYPRNKALLSNGVIVDDDGMAMLYGAGREVGSVAAIPEAKDTMNTAQMMAEIAVTFPTLKTRPLREFDKQYANAEGIWTGADGDMMPDGYEIFASTSPDPDLYDGYVHMGFLAWLEARGWAYDAYDGGTYFLVPLSYFDEPVSAAG